MNRKHPWISGILVALGGLGAFAIIFVLLVLTAQKFLAPFFQPPPPVPLPRIYFPTATLNGRPVRLALDTGAEMTSLFDSGAQRFHLKTEPLLGAKFNSVLDILALTDAASLTVDQDVATTRLPVMLNIHGEDGLVGWPDVQDNQILVFDSTHHIVRRLEKLPPDSADWLKLKIHPDLMLLLELPLPDGTTGLVTVDTGSPGGVALPPDSWKAWLVSHPQAPTSTVNISMPGKPAQSQEAWADTLALGDLTLSDVPVHEANPVEMNHHHYLGTLGLYALSRVDLIADLKNGVAYLRPNHAPAAPYPLNPSPPTPVAKNPPPSGDWTVDPAIRLNFNHLQYVAASLAGSHKLEQGDFTGAIADLTQALALEPNHADAWGNRGIAKLKHGDYESALADLNQALALDPNIIQALLALSASKINNADFAGAIADLDRILTLDSKNSGAFTYRGVAKYNQGDYPAALIDFDYALTLDPQSIPTLSFHGLAQFKRGNFTAYIADNSRIIELDPHNLTAYLDRSYGKADSGDFAGAIADCNLLLELDPKNSAAYFNRAYAENLQGNFSGALSDSNQGLELKRDGSVYRLIYVQLLRRRLGLPPGDFSATVAGWKEDWSKSVGQFVAGTLPESDFLAAAAQGDEATTREHQCEAYYYIGMLYLLQNDLSAARDYFQKCLATNRVPLNEYHFAQAELARLPPPAPTKN